MASETGKIVGLVFVLVLLLGAVGWIYSYQNTKDMKEMSPSTGNSDVQLITVMGEKVIPSKKVVVSDKFVGNIDNDGVIVAISSDGQAYNVREGVVLADGMVVSASDEGYSVYRIDEPAKSVSSN